MEFVADSFGHGLVITIFVFVMMVLVDYFNVLTEGRLQSFSRRSLWQQYLVAALLGVLPGCLGAFMAVTMYVHGILSFGALSACMVATSGDESFVMFAMFPQRALLVHLALFGIGFLSGFVIDKTAPLLRIKPCEECALTEIHRGHEGRLLNAHEIASHLKKISLSRFLLMFLTGACIYLVAAGIIGPGDWGWKKITFIVLLGVGLFIVTTVPDHYLQEHIWEHIARKHIWKVFLWTFGALFVVEIATASWDVEPLIRSHMLWVLLAASLVGLIPQSGPNLVFVMMLADGLIPMSVLITNCIVQEGHGMLPLLSYTVRDAVLVKAFKLVLGLAVGLALYSLGM